MENDEHLINITEYAELHGVALITVRHRVMRKRFNTAKRIANEWFIDKDEPYVDNRITSGKYRSWRD